MCGNVTRNKDNAKAMVNFFWTAVNFEFEYFLSEENVDILTDIVMNFNDWHLTWLSYIKPNVKVGQSL